jgi:hypothetical protein
MLSAHITRNLAEGSDVHRKAMLHNTRQHLSNKLTDLMGWFVMNTDSKNKYAI